jgi:L-ascorbate metabolism protein UlaG (beta-lactamase superfamily)
MTRLRWLGHGSWEIKTAEHTVLLDPFLNDNPTSPVSADEMTADFILVSHGHFDHVADVASIANRCGATVVAIYEIAEWFGTNHSVENAIGMNIGGTVKLPFGDVKMTPALHSSQLPDGSYGGMPAGFVVAIGDSKVYFACDTALFSDMALVGAAGIDLAVVPIGDHFTMGPDESVEAVKLIGPKRAAPAHYNTFPPIEQDANAWADRIRAETDAEPVVVEPGGLITL